MDNKTVTASFFKQNDLVQRCQKNQLLPENKTLLFSVAQGESSTMQHKISQSHQKIYVHVEQDAQCVLTTSDQLSFNEDLKSVEFHIVVEQDAMFEMFLAVAHANSIQCFINVYLQGPRAIATVKGVYALDKKQQLDIQTYQYHGACDTKSSLVMKGMLKDSSKVSYQGLIKIDEQAKGTDASQENKNIVLSKEAKVVSVPSIEVLQYDVQCCHGSAIGKFDEEQLWYLQSKGLGNKQAQTLLIKSFFNDVLDGVKNQNKLLEVLCKKMV